jgi:hypothetical protein
LCTQLVFCRILFIFGILVGHDLSMCILYRFHGRLIFVRVIVLFMFVWIKFNKRQMTSCIHKMCRRTYGQTNMKRASTLAKINHPWNWYNMRHIWYLGWPWSEHVHIIPISRKVDFCESYCPFHVCLTICPSAHLVYATSHLSFVWFYSNLVSWLAMIV